MNAGNRMVRPRRGLGPGIGNRRRGFGAFYQTDEDYDACFPRSGGQAHSHDRLIVANKRTYHRLDYSRLRNWEAGSVAIGDYGVE